MVHRGTAALSFAARWIACDAVAGPAPSPSIAAHTIQGTNELRVRRPREPARAPVQAGILPERPYTPSTPPECVSGRRDAHVPPLTFVLREPHHVRRPSFCLASLALGGA